jgi:hypothetical protein
MTGVLIDSVRPDEPRLERIRSLIAAIDGDERAIRVLLVLAHEAVRRALAASTETVADIPLPRFDAERWGVDGYERISTYEALLERVRERTMAIVAPGARIAMVSRGDDRLLRLDERVAEHFPQDSTGRYAGYYPEDASRAIQQLRELRQRGVQFLVFPATAYWWFDFYVALARWLAPALAWSCEDCAVYELAQLADGQERAA